MVGSCPTCKLFLTSLVEIREDYPLHAVRFSSVVPGNKAQKSVYIEFGC